MTVSLAIECLVAVLLLVTIGYCGLLNRRLKLLRGDEEMLKATIGELITATEIAERAIVGLKATVVDAESSLGERLRQAERVSGRIGQEMQAAEAVLQRLGQISALAREAGLAPASRERSPFHRSPERAA